MKFRVVAEVWNQGSVIRRYTRTVDAESKIEAACAVEQRLLADGLLTADERGKTEMKVRME